MRWAMLTALLVPACSTGGAEPSDDPADDTDAPTRPDPRVPLPAADAAVRASMALLGRRPTPRELDRVIADRAALDGLVATWIEDPALGTTVRDWWAEVLSMRSVDLLYPQLGPVATTPGQAVRDAVVEEPLALIERVVLEDLPFTEIVTADWTVLDRTASKMWSGHTFDRTGDDVQVVRWTDGRPAAGILSTNGLWARHVSAGANYHRGRANRIADALLCEDFLVRDVNVSGDVDLADDAAVAHALTTNPDCVGCHQALDPLAGHLWVFHPEYSPGAVGLAYLTGCATPFLELCYPFDPYRPTYDLGRLLLQLRPNGYYGQASDDLGTLGQSIAEDPRFASCAVRRAWSHLAQVPLDEVPFEPAARLQQRFVEGGYDMKRLLGDIALHPDFLAADATDPAIAARLPGPLTARPWQQASVVEQLTGFRYVVGFDDLLCTVGGILCYGDVDVSTDDLFGYRSMAGGTDGVRVLRPTHTPTSVKLLFAAALAEEAAGWVVARDLDLAPAERRLLGLVERDTWDEAAVRAQLVDLHARILAERVEPSSPVIDATYTLWSTVSAASGKAPDGWRAVVAAMLQDPRLLYY